MALTSGTTPAASLAIIVKANTAAATAGLAKVDAQGRAVAATQGTLAKSSTRTSSAMRKLGTAAKYGGLALGAAFVIEAKRAVTTTQELTKSTISLHKNLGLSNKQASEWAGVAKARGVDSTKLGMAFKTLATQITAARDGSATAVTMFKRLGFSQEDIRKGAQDTEFAVKKTADGIKALGAGADRTAIEGKLFGRGWQTIAPVMRDGSKAMQEQLDTVEKYGGVLQGKTLKQQEALLANIRENKIAWQGFQVTLASFVTPALNTVSEQFQRIAAINADPNLTGEEKWRRISHIINDDLNKALGFLTNHLLPEMIKRIGETGPKLAGALLKSFFNAFVNSDLLGKLFIAGTFLRLIGGKGALGKIGVAIAKWMFGPIFATTAAENMAAGMAAPSTASKMKGAFRGLGIAAGAIFGFQAVSGIIETITSGLQGGGVHGFASRLGQNVASKVTFGLIPSAEDIANGLQTNLTSAIQTIGKHNFRGSINIDFGSEFFHSLGGVNFQIGDLASRFRALRTAQANVIPYLKSIGRYSEENVQTTLDQIDATRKQLHQVNNIPKTFGELSKTLRDPKLLQFKSLQGIIQRLREMAPESRGAVIKMLAGMAGELRAKGKLPKVAFQRLMGALRIAQGETGRHINKNWRSTLSALADTTVNHRKLIAATFGNLQADLRRQQGKTGDIVVTNWKDTLDRLIAVTKGKGRSLNQILLDFATRLSQMPGGSAGGGHHGGHLSTGGKGRPNVLGGRHGAQHGGYVTDSGIIPVGFQHGGMVGRRGMRPGKRDTVPAMLEPGELVIPKKVVEDTRKNAKLAAVAMTGELGKGTKGALKNAVDFVKKHGVSMKLMKDTAGKFTEALRKGTIDEFTKTKEQSGQQTDRLKQQATDDFTRMHGNVVQQMNKTRDQSTKASQQTQKGVTKNFREMAAGAGEGINILAKLTNNALDALGVKKVDFKAVKVKGKQRGGHIGGTGDGDTIPAMLEPGEFVVNKRAAAKHRRSLEAINFQDAPRFAKGGAVQPNFGGHPSNVASSLAKLIGIMQGQFPGLGVSATTDGTHVANSDHYTGHAVDLASPDFGYMDKAAGWVMHSGLYKQLKQGIHNPNLHVNAGAVVPSSFYADVWAGHRNHIHLAVYDALKGAFGAAAQKIAEVIVKGPKGPLTDMANAAVSKVHDAAQKYVDKKAAAADVGTGISADGNVERVFARVAKQLSTSKTATLALGEAGFAESGMRDLPGGDSTSQGALQLLASTAAGMGINPHDEGAISSAFLLRGFYGKGGANKLAGQGLPAHLVAQGVQGSAFSDGSNYAAQIGPAKGWMRQFGLRRGGWIGMAKGGDPKKHPDVTSKDVEQGLASLSAKKMFELMGVLAKGPAAGHEGLRHKVSKMLLGKIADVRKGTPVKPKGHLHDYLNELDVLTLKMKLHKKGKPHEKAFQNLVDWLGDPEDGFYTWQTLRNRKDKWRRLQIKRDIAAKTPNPKDDIRIAKIIADFTGKSAKPGNKDALDAAARTQQLFDFLKLLGPVTSLSTFGRGGKLGSGKFGIAGESGPELIRGPATISSPQETSSMLSPSFDVRVFIGDRELTNIVDVQIDRKDRAKDLKRRTGVSPAR